MPTQLKTSAFWQLLWQQNYQQNVTLENYGFLTIPKYQEILANAIPYFRPRN
ncbi:MAG: hypothetical protein ICV54_24095 [Nostoc sp. C3-bin3]|nr:hypothetical protein [Nostoc sp. C3-bin3]